MLLHGAYGIVIAAVCLIAARRVSGGLADAETKNNLRAS